jgi:hypothetical protein
MLILPPEPIRLQVYALRARHDPVSHAICDPHVSLTVPLSRQCGKAHRYELAAVASGIRPFEVRYGPVTNSLAHLGVVLSIEPQTELDRLRLLLEACSVFEGAAPRSYPVLGAYDDC